jgi:pimeloyl-ACP methyl ester carboxylesterase
MPRGHVILSHGLESGPEATKVRTLAALAEAHGWRSERPDYRDCRDWPARLERLLERMDRAAAPVVLIGSSLGAWISAWASTRRRVAGLVLLAPPIRLPGHAEPLEWEAERVLLIHGWRDELIPAETVMAAAARRRAALLLLDDDHRLHASLARIEIAVARILAECAVS